MSSKPVRKTKARQPEKPAARIARPESRTVSAVKPREDDARLSAQEVKAIKAYLQTTRDEVLRRLQEKKSLDMPEAEVGDPIDQASQSLDKEVLFEVTDKDQLTLEQIESALRRIEKNVYGMCESCRCIIPRKRLKALPFARYCIHCQSSNESSSIGMPTPE
ncbi:MAG: TraR/DksA family transcriptional regulator [Elusimicrobiales bacterium]